MSTSRIVGGNFPVLAVSSQFYPQEGPRVVMLSYDFTTGSTFADDLSAIIDNGRMTTVQTVWVDAADCGQPVTITLAESGQRIRVPAHTQGIYPVFVAGGAGFTVSGGDGVSTVALGLLNVPMPFAQWRAQ